MATFFSPNDILLHLQTYIPRLSDRFSDNAIVTAVIVDGTPQILRITDTAHGLSAGRQVALVDGKIDNPITAVSDNGDGTIRFTTENEHDLTLDYTLTVELSGFDDSAFNAEFALTAVPSRTTFEVKASSLPVLSGSEVLRESWELGINGLFAIDRIVDANTYEIDLTDKPYFTPQTIPQLKRASNFRMGVTVDALRAKSIYTKQADNTKLWLYVIMGDSTASKDRTIKSDATQTNTAQNPARVLMINTFTLLVVYPTSGELAGAEAVQLSWHENLILMLAAVAGIKFDDFGNTFYRTTLIDHGTSVYDNATYSHAYTFEYNYEVTQDEQFITQFIESRAFRDDALSFNELQEGSTISLDEEET